MWCSQGSREVLTFYHSVLWIVWWCHLGIQGSVWDSDGKEFFHLPSQLKRISARLDGLSSTLEASVFFAVTSVLFHQDLSWRHV